MNNVKLRRSQEAIVAYTGGRMGVSAVPGSGKTFTLSHLAAALVERLADAGLADEQEVLIVTFTNPAVNTFRKRIADLVQQERGLLPYVGYRVRTLHGLAHDIVRMRPSLVGLSEGFEIADERVTTTIIRELAETWLRHNADQLIAYVDLPFAEEESQLRHLIRRNGADLVEDIANEVIRLAKDNRWGPDEMRAALGTALESAPVELPLAQVGIHLYEDYQRSLSYRGAVDFDDLVRLAMQALEADPLFLERLQNQWPYILEDEAQDSSKLQNAMLRLLSAERHWVRVGDPNQAIYTTFTTADANFLRRFLAEPGVADRPLQKSGRSAPPIVALANELVRWAKHDNLIAHLHDTFYEQRIEPTPPGDPQQNPDEGFVHLDWSPEVNITPEKEIERVVASLERWLPDHPDWTVAVLAPENSRGFQVAEALEERGLPYEELLRSTSATRDAAARLQSVLDCLANPTSSRELAQLYTAWLETVAETLDDEIAPLHGQVATELGELKTTEDFLWPGPERDFLADLDEAYSPVIPHLEAFRTQVQFWLRAASLPVDQLILTISQGLFIQPEDLALAYKIAVVLRGIANNNPDYRLPELSQELRRIAQNQRRFLGFDDAVTGYEPKPGVVTVATMHAAKGLEWDRVYLMAVNSYSFPAALPGESYIAEKWFIRDELNLQAEAHEQVTLLMEGQAGRYKEGEASRQARIEYAMERLRLLYVGITRAKRDLVITWNMGRYWEQGRRNTAAQALIALNSFWKEQ